MYNKSHVTNNRLFVTTAAAQHPNTMTSANNPTRPMMDEWMDELGMDGWMD
jgi:hypothetical protein